MDKSDKKYKDYVYSPLSQNEGVSEFDITDTCYPNMYEVFLSDGGSVPVDLTIYVLENIFHISLQQAKQLAEDVSLEKPVLCGVYTKEVAETKVMQIESQILKKVLKKGCYLKCNMRKRKRNVIEKP